MHILEEFDRLPEDVHRWFMSETFVELGVFVPGAKPLRQAEHSIDSLPGVAETLGEIAGIVPAPIDDEPVAAVDRRPVAVADAVHPRYRHPAALGIEKTFGSMRKGCLSVSPASKT